ncbi:Zn(2)-C6 fungal-type domain-containing protein [Fusarium sp. LHS14.1]|nr:Zn(2)-C6 fungal-type domain-containing protein [Fusarium sp. LHS14.1]
MMSTAAADRPKPATAKWGAACSQCATAKAKCIRSNSAPGAKCDRCERLVKVCTEQVHRPRKKRQPKPSRTAQIEERLNGLVNLLKASGGLTNADLATDTTCIPTEADPAVSNQQKPSSKSSDASFAPGSSPWAIPDTYNSYAPPQCICRPASGDAPPPPASDEVLLNIYRNELLALHPFVVIPRNVTAARLKATRPFLMSAIRMVTSFRSLRSMRAQMYYLMRHIADHMLIRSERSLDLLMGIIVIAAWYQYHCFMHAQLNNLIAMAVTLVGELGLHRSPTVLERTNLMVVKPFQPERRTNEERRVLLGVWFLSSAMSLGFSRIESMRYTKYIQECLGVLEREKEYPTDTRLVYLVRIQHLTERISQLNSPDDPAEEVAGLPTAPLSAYVSAFQGELDRIRNGLPPELKDDRIICTFINTAALRLYETPVLDAPRIISMSESLTSPTLGAASALDIFYQSRNALKQWFDNWLAIPISEYYCQTTPVAAQIVYALTVLGRWAKFTVPITLTGPKTPMPHDTSADNPNVEQFKADSEYSASLSSRKATPAGSTPGHENDPTECSQIVLREGTDPRLPAAVASLRSQIQTQPGLSLDVSGILTGVCSRFEEANATFQVASTEPGASDHNLWSMSAIKIRITRAKLERWAEIVAAGTEALKIQDEESRDTDMEDDSHHNNETGKSATDGTETFIGGDFPVDPLQMQNWNGGTPWTTEMLQGVDPSVWFDGYLDWGAVIMNSMGNLEQ